MAHTPAGNRFARRTLVLAIAALFGGHAVTNASTDTPAAIAEWRGLPITFERNDGQHPPAVLFSSRGPHGVLNVGPGELVVVPSGVRGADQARFRFAGANLTPEVEPAQPLAARSHY